uniref:Uncharacterized protein n=1 Tax=Oryza rufipogon TaxID=4529 RepID=A0A0E0Q503_ORYRU
MLAGIKDTLCTAHWDYHFYVVDLWFLTDSEKGTWSKEYRINVDPSFYGIGDCVKVHPLLVTDEGNVVLWLQMPSEGIVQIYNPVTNTFWDITQTSIYTGVDGWIRDWFLYSDMIYFTLQHLVILREGWTLFYVKAFSRLDDRNCPLNLKTVAERITEKCQGLPLALVAIGSLLSYKEMEEHEKGVVL